MTVKEFLSLSYRLDNHIEVEMMKLEQLRKNLYSLPSVSDDTPVQHSRKPDAAFTNIVDKIVDREKEINALIDRYADIKKSIEELIDSIPDEDCKLIVQYRYLCRLSWKEIAEKLYIASATVRRKHDRTLEELEQSELFQKKGKNEQE